jgi:hypothetical protein
MYDYLVLTTELRVRGSMVVVVGLWYVCLKEAQDSTGKDNRNSLSERVSSPLTHRFRALKGECPCLGLRNYWGRPIQETQHE